MASSNNNGGIKRNTGVPLSGPIWPSSSSSTSPRPANPAPSPAPVHSPRTAPTPPTSTPLPPVPPTLTPAPITTNFPPPHTKGPWTRDPAWACATIPDEHFPMNWCTTWCYMNDLDWMDQREDYPGFGRRLLYEKEEQAALLAELDRELNAAFGDLSDDEDGAAGPSSQTPTSSSSSSPPSSGTTDQWDDIV